MLFRSQRVTTPRFDLSDFDELWDAMHQGYPRVGYITVQNKLFTGNLSLIVQNRWKASLPLFPDGNRNCLLIPLQIYILLSD